MISVCAVLAEEEQQHGAAGEPGRAACGLGQHTHGPQEWPPACSWHLLQIQTAVPLVRALLPVRASVGCLRGVLMPCSLCLQDPGEADCQGEGQGEAQFGEGRETLPAAGQGAG